MATNRTPRMSGAFFFSARMPLNTNENTINGKKRVRNSLKMRLKVKHARMLVRSSQPPKTITKAMVRISWTGKENNFTNTTLMQNGRKNASNKLISKPLMVPQSP